ncbi:MAG: hypothetical protein PHU65_05135, partial [Actinomycetota bacterium]|nr:hypothetical protein [Actinomycetota bacterium]
SFLYGEKEFRLIFLRNTVVALVRFGACATVLYFARDYMLTILAYLAVVTLGNTIFFLVTYRKVKDRERDPVKDKEYIKHGVGLTGASAVSVIAKNIERLILDAVSNVTMVGIYSIVAVFPNFIKNGLKNLINVPAVKLAAYSEQENRRIIKKALILIFLFGLAIIAIFWFITPFLLSFFYKVSDPQIMLYGKLMLLPLLFMPVNLTIKYMVSYQGSGKRVFKLYTSIDILKLALLAIFIPLYEIQGIIIALILAEFLSSVILLVWFFRSNKKYNLK